MTDELLRRLEERIVCMDEKLDKVRTEDLPGLRVEVAREVAALKVKAGLWGAVAGAIPAITMLVLMLLRDRL